MALTEEETYKVERWLKRKHVNVEEVAGFTFMQYYKPRPSKCKPYCKGGETMRVKVRSV